MYAAKSDGERGNPIFVPTTPGTGNKWNKKLEFLKGCSWRMFSCLLIGEHRRG